MDFLKDFLQLLAGMKWSDYVDILIVAIVIYSALTLLRATNTLRVAMVVLAIVVTSWVTEVLKLYALNYIINSFLQVGVLALIILFQPELRRMLDHLGSVRLERIFHPDKVTQDLTPVIRQTVQACEVMSREKIGQCRR